MGSNVASLDLCRELYELSTWSGGVDNWYCFVQDTRAFDADHWSVFNRAVRPPGHSKQVPAYALGYLLRKLPSGVTLFTNSNGGNPNDYSIKYEHDDWITADTPEDAAAKLAIELIKQGVLK